MEETAWFRGEGGALLKLALPLPEVYADQQRAGRLTRVDPPAAAPAPSPAPVADKEPADAGVNPELGSLERPARSDSKADWLAYAGQVSPLTADELGEMTKADLIERFGG